MILTEAELREMISEVVVETTKRTAQEFKNQLAAMGISLSPQASFSLDADQKSIKSHLHVYTSTTPDEINKMIDYAINGLTSARGRIDTMGFNAAPLERKQPPTTTPEANGKDANNKK